MFTGIATNIGIIKKIETNQNCSYIIKTDMDLSDVKIGSSILCSGICLTAVKKEKNFFIINISEETLNSSTAKFWKIGKRINLEKSLKLGDELSGHMVTGHVDQVTKLLSKKKLENSILLNFSIPSSLRKFICRKGSIAIDGISLTINDVKKNNFFINIIPHTELISTLGDLVKGDKVNLEIDILARYIDQNINYKK